MDYRILKVRFRQFGGMRLLRQYARIGVLWTGIKALFHCIVKRKSFKTIYSELLTKVEPFLVRRYKSVMIERKAFYHGQGLEQKKAKIIWFCWLQGLERAPSIVISCYNSLKQNLTDREIKVVDADNWQEHVDLPEYIVEKWKRKRIPAANFSDLLRLQLLTKYG